MGKVKAVATKCFSCLVGHGENKSSLECTKEYLSDFYPDLMSLASPGLCGVRSRNLLPQCRGLAFFGPSKQCFK